MRCKKCRQVRWDMTRYDIMLTKSGAHWLPLSTSSATKHVKPSNPSRLPIEPAHPLHALTTFWIHSLGCGQNLSKASWKVVLNVRNVTRTSASMRGKACSVAAVTGLCQVSALPKAGSTKQSQDRTTTMAFECHHQLVAGNQAKVKAICER